MLLMNLLNPTTEHSANFRIFEQTFDIGKENIIFQGILFNLFEIGHQQSRDKLFTITIEHYFGNILIHLE